MATDMERVTRAAANPLNLQIPAPRRSKKELLLTENVGKLEKLWSGERGGGGGLKNGHGHVSNVWNKQQLEVGHMFIC
jgi:hypothetical protein